MDHAWSRSWAGNWYGITSPCKDCKDRKVGCHDHCQKYLEFRERINNYHENVQKNHK